MTLTLLFCILIVNCPPVANLALWPTLASEGETSGWWAFFGALLLFIQQAVAFYDRRKAVQLALASAERDRSTQIAVEAARQASAAKIGEVNRKLEVVKDLVDGNLGHVLNDLAIVKRKLASLSGLAVDISAADAAERASDDQAARVRQAELPKESQGQKPSPG